MDDHDLQAIRFYRRSLARRMKLNKPRPLQDHLAGLIPSHHQGPLKILDAGSAIFSTIGTEHGYLEVELTACDILAGEWNAILKRRGITPHVPVEYQNMEALTYGDCSFHLVHCGNSLDHVRNAPQALRELIRVCKSPGYVYLSHFRNQGEKQGYHGQHRWNLQRTTEGDCLLWNKEQQVPFSGVHQGFDTIEHTTRGGAVHVVSLLEL